jgi:D-glycerate 3-kinase
VTPADGLPELLAGRIAAAAAARPGLVVGLTGPQGSGKSTLAARLAPLLGEHGLRAAVLSLDDLYLTKAQRQALARKVHPLLATRGVPGTHDAPLGANLMHDLRTPVVTLVPRFDKARDDRLPLSAWRRVEGPVDVILFEGWCVGARPQPDAALAAPVNALERTRDAEGVWRRYVNDMLRGPYDDLFGPVIGLQVLLRAPDFEAVLGWRQQQEHELIARTGQGQSDAELAQFVQHYERLSRWIDAEMPGRADISVQLGPDREVARVS